MLNLIWLKSLIMVIEQRSFQAAAEQLGLAQPTTRSIFRSWKKRSAYP